MDSAVDAKNPMLMESKHVRRLNATEWQFNGPQFISNLDGLVLEMDDEGTIRSQQFTGDRNQQWLLHSDPMGTGRVAFASFQDGRYVNLSHFGAIVAMRTPFFWDYAVGEIGRCSLSARKFGNPRLTLPTPHGPCTVSSPTVDNETVNLVILQNTDEVQAALKSGSIGSFAYPGAPVYYTDGTAGKILVRNHLDITLYGAVSGPGSTAQWPILPGATEYWNRSSDASVHISTPISDTGEQSAQVYEGRVGKILHIQNLGGQETWHGVRFVPIEDATYTANPPDKPGVAMIGVTNDLGFDIYVSILDSLRGGNAGQFVIKPNTTDFWNRGDRTEMVFVSFGSAPGMPKAYVGRPGFMLHIERW